MARKKRTAMQAFELNMADAYFLADLAGGLTNQRARRMRKELRERVGEALSVSGKRREQLDCVESDDFFVVLKAETRLDRERLKDVRPLLRQAVVAGSAAFETYVADRVMELVGPVLRRRPLPRRLGELSMTFEQFYDINSRYERTAWGVRELVARAVTTQASPAPNQVGAVFAMVDEREILKRVDVELKRPNTTSQRCLEHIYDRRNAIAHTGDRVGRGRADIDRSEVVADLNELCAIANAIDTVTPAGG